MIKHSSPSYKKEYQEDQNVSKTQNKTSCLLSHFLLTSMHSAVFNSPLNLFNVVLFVISSEQLFHTLTPLTAMLWYFALILTCLNLQRLPLSDMEEINIMIITKSFPQYRYRCHVTGVKSLVLLYWCWSHELHGNNMKCDIKPKLQFSTVIASNILLFFFFFEEFELCVCYDQYIQQTYV